VILRQRCGVFAAWTAFFFSLVPGLCAQTATAPKHIGFPQDWSQGHLVFSRDALAKHPGLADREPRIRQQLMQRFPTPSNSTSNSSVAPSKVSIKPKPKPSLYRDWNVVLGGRIFAHMFPVKYSFADPTAPPDCTNDYAAFGLSAPETPGVGGGNANLVGFNNLYSGTAPVGLCGTAPTPLFGYNISTVTGGKILTSPILSLDGKKIGFVESVTGATPSSIFHVLTWNAGDGGTPTTSVVPTAGEMTSLTISSTATITTSAPWIDYSDDVVYVGDDTGKIYKITGVFNGTPALAGSPWPLQVGAQKLTPPVFDIDRRALLVGSTDGNLYQVNTLTGTLSSSLLVGGGAPSPGVVSPPIVDITNGTTFVTSADDGTSAVLVEADTNSLTLLTRARIGMGAFGSTAMSLYEPALSNAYFYDTSSGVIRVCGTGAADQSPWQYAFGFNAGRIMNSTPSFSQQIVASTAARCTGLTEFNNPFVEATDVITATAVASNVLTVTAKNDDLTVGEQITIQGTGEPLLNGQVVTVASVIGAGPIFTGFTANFTTPDYVNAADTGMVSATDTITATSVATNVLTVTTNASDLQVGQQISLQRTAESFLNGQVLIVASLIGTAPVYSGFTANFNNPDYTNAADTGGVTGGTDFFFFGLNQDCTAPGNGFTDGCVVARSSDTTVTKATINGGPNGIVVDNYSTASQAASIYFMASRANIAYKFTQNGLQ